MPENLMGQLAGKQSTGEPRPVDLCIVCTCSEDKWYMCYRHEIYGKGGKVGDKRIPKCARI